MCNAAQFLRMIVLIVEDPCAGVGIHPEHHGII